MHVVMLMSYQPARVSKAGSSLRLLTSCCISISGRPQLRTRGAFSVVGWGLFCALCQAKPPSQERESGRRGGGSFVKASSVWVEVFKDLIDTAMIRPWSIELPLKGFKLPINKVKVSPWRGLGIGQSLKKILDGNALDNTYCVSTC